MTRHRKSGPPKRRPSDVGIRLEILVFREGLRTEEIYLNYWRRRFRERVTVNIDPDPAGPLQLVERAVAAKKLATRDAKKGRGRAYDEIWCVFDRDIHPNLEKARALASAHGIHVAMSNPCIELWFVLHFEDQTASIERGDAQSRSKKLLGCGKHLNEDALRKLADSYEEAATRARSLDKKHEGDGSPFGSNPSSGIYRLIDNIRNA